MTPAQTAAAAGNALEIFFSASGTSTSAAAGIFNPSCPHILPDLPERFGRENGSRHGKYIMLLGGDMCGIEAHQPFDQDAKFRQVDVRKPPRFHPFASQLIQSTVHLFSHPMLGGETIHLFHHSGGSASEGGEGGKQIPFFIMIMSRPGAIEIVQCGAQGTAVLGIEFVFCGDTVENIEEFFDSSMAIHHQFNGVVKIGLRPPANGNGHRQLLRCGAGSRPARAVAACFIFDAVIKPWATTNRHAIFGGCVRRRPRLPFTSISIRDMPQFW
jgi:hypothetical protein